MQINNLIILGLFLALGVGYIIGYYFGKRDGKEEGKLIAPILLRRNSLQKGYCILCKSNKNSQALQGKKDEM